MPRREKGSVYFYADEVSQLFLDNRQVLGLHEILRLVLWVTGI